MIFKKKKINDNERDVRELLRENLNILPVDMFYGDDPMLKMTQEEKIMYLKSFFDIYKDEKLIERIKYNINKQAQRTLGNSKDMVHDMAGAMNINGMAFVMEDINRLANLYIKETTKPPEKPLDKFSIIPKVEE